MNLWIKYSYFFLLCLLFFGCQSEEENVVLPDNDTPSITKDESIAMSQQWIKDESFRIDKFVERLQWPVRITETGIRYWVYEDVSGDDALPDQVAVVDFEIRLLDADTTLCYSSKENGSQEFLIEMDRIESGLHEAICYLSEGDKAFVILPHYLAHGLAGDMDKIPPLSPVLYDIHLLEIKEK